jgi:hypothetical protein
MGLKFTVTKEDVLRTKVLKPGWYTFDIKDITEEQSKSDSESNNIVVKLVVTDGAKLPSGSPSTGVPVTMWFSEKFKGEAAISFAAAISGKTMKEIEETGVDMDNVENLKGRKIKGNVENGEYKGKATNTVVRFEAVK